MPMRKVPVAWQTGPGGVGVSVFYTPFGTDATVDIGTFFNAIKAQFPTGISWDIPASGDVVDEATGLITGAWTAGTAATITGTAVGVFAAGTGAYVKWQTAGIVGGRRVRGRTFLAPLITGAFDNIGTIATAPLSTFNSAASALAATGKLLIWHRPTDTPRTNGSQHAVVAATVPDKVTSLRTRRT